MTLLPTTMVGAYPRPAWFTQQLDGRAFRDAVRTVIGEQESAGLDLCTDGQMWFDDYAMGIGAFFWYWFERIGGFGHEKLEHPARAQTTNANITFVLFNDFYLMAEQPFPDGTSRGGFARLWRDRDAGARVRAGALARGRGGG